MSDPAVAQDADPPETAWTFRRLYTYVVSLANGAGIGCIVWRVHDDGALKWLGLALIASNVVLATLYLAGATVTDYAKLAAAWKGRGQ